MDQEPQGKILVVEDEVSLRNALRDKFTQEGFSLLEARNGEHGLEIALREHPDLILLDIAMQRMDGIAMLKKLRQDPWGKDAKVIVLTNLNAMEKMAEAVAQGSYEYLIKSNWKLEDVVKKVCDKLNE